LYTALNEAIALVNEEQIEVFTSCYVAQQNVIG